jgi:myxalamid-type polyketide synthase MxaE and MxaD
VLKITPSRLDPRKALGDLGLNSLMAMELRNRLETALGHPLSATLAWNHPTVDALVTHLAGGESVAAPQAAASTPADSPADMAARLDELNTLSDEEAVHALRPRRKRS